MLAEQLMLLKNLKYLPEPGSLMTWMIRHGINRLEQLLKYQKIKNKTYTNINKVKFIVVYNKEHEHFITNFFVQDSHLVESKFFLHAIREQFNITYELVGGGFYSDNGIYWETNSLGDYPLSQSPLSEEIQSFAHQRNITDIDEWALNLIFNKIEQIEI